MIHLKLLPLPQLLLLLLLLLILLHYFCHCNWLLNYYYRISLSKCTPVYNMHYKPCFVLHFEKIRKRKTEGVTGYAKLRVRNLLLLLLLQLLLLLLLLSSAAATSIRTMLIFLDQHPPYCLTCTRPQNCPR